MTYFIKLPIGARKISKITLSIINFRCNKPSEQGKKKKKSTLGPRPEPTPYLHVLFRFPCDDPLSISAVGADVRVCSSASPLGSERQSFSLRFECFRTSFYKFAIIKC